MAAMLLTRYGIREWGIATIVAAAIVGRMVWLQWWWAIPVVVIVWLAFIAFFRDPIRSLPRDLKPGDMIAPADGVVSAVGEVEHHDATGGPAIIIRIFLSVLDVHVNRSPCDGEVVAVEHKPGAYFDARSEECPRVNEAKLLTLRIETGETIGVRQIVGKVARRIVCPVEVGRKLRRGEKYGMIKFGSSTELILPRPNDVTVHIKQGDRARGGKTVIATLA